MPIKEAVVTAAMPKPELISPGHAGNAGADGFALAAGLADLLELGLA